MILLRSHYSKKASALDFKGSVSPQFGHSDVVFDVLIYTNTILHLIALSSNISKPFCFSVKFSSLSIFADDRQAVRYDVRC